MEKIQLLLPRREGVIYHGKNITKLKFPCLCTFRNEGHISRGILMKGWEERGYDLYELHLIEQQEDLTRVYEDRRLMDLLTMNEVELKEGEITFY